MPKGIVEAVTTKEVKTKYGMKPTFSVKVDGEWYSNGFTDPRVSKGDEIAFEFTEGKYGNEFDKGTVMRVGRAEPTTAPAKDVEVAAPKSAPFRPFPIPALHGDRAIIRQNALSHATKLYSSFITPGASVYGVDTMSFQVIELARKFEAYACGDLDMAEAKIKAAKKAVAEELGE
jgi:hypothetical protein